MEQAVAQRKPRNSSAGLVPLALRAPGRVVGGLLGAHLVVWTLLPILLSPNLQLDLAEGLALGREWQLGYWKHPPLPWWVDDLLYRLTAQIDSVYVLGPVASVLCLYGIWLLASEVLDEFAALVSVIALEGVHFYNFSAVKFGHDQLQLPFWAFTGLFFYRALNRNRKSDWILAGAFLAGAFWSKYAAFVLAVTLGLFLLFDPEARRAWGTRGPYMMATAFAIIIAPNAWWLVTNDFLPFHYVDQRALGATHWYQYLAFPAIWIASNAFTLLPMIGVLAILIEHPVTGPPETDAKGTFDRRYITVLALGPFAVTTVIAAALGRLPVTMWAYPLWSFAPLATLVWLPPINDDRRLSRFAVASIFVLLAFPIAYVAAQMLEPFVRDRPKATEFPGQLLADTVTQKWHEATGTPIAYVGGADFVKGTGAGEFAANLIAVYSADRPRVIVHGNPSLSPWIDRADLDRRGAVLVWDSRASEEIPADLRSTFPTAELQPPLVLPRHTLYPRPPVNVSYAFVRPRETAF
jgi:hypothetical protein